MEGLISVWAVFGEPLPKTAILSIVTLGPPLGGPSR